MFIVHKYKLTFRKYPLKISLNSKGKSIFLSSSSFTLWRSQFSFAKLQEVKFG